MNKHPTAAGGDPEAVASALMKRQVNRREEVPLEEYEALLRELSLPEGEERESAKHRLYQLVGLPDYT